MTKNKGLSIGAVMKNRMENQDVQVENTETEEQGQLTKDKFQDEGGDVALTPVPSLHSADDPMEGFNTRIPRSLQRRLKLYAVSQGVKLQDVVQEALGEYLRKKDRKQD